ncbi:MAG: hypothetical protein LBF80_04365 [Spirochaetaceae bacterium]|nr:hypothetical protein [Spirochaetaceae bacterium]
MKQNAAHCSYAGGWWTGVRGREPRMQTAFFGPEGRSRSLFWVCCRVADLKPAGGF